MTFKYHYYENYLLYGALVGLFIGTIFFVFALYHFRSNIRNSQNRTVSYFVIILILIFSIYALYASSVNLRFGINLLFEDETAIVEQTGRIENIEEMKLIYVQYNEDGKITCQLVTIDGKNYLFISTGDLEIGDFVSVNYLPKSRIVLQWEHLTG
ncbi:MAG: hypothetical protein A2Y45_04795 [Tenericutes bacterium GWC2_34_14]|nr:MAG: hypothetical protein A2Z84_00940 [Tenericutes bacterium GWA2_35_7]OHE29115.1 MAG: hypothetical protein A2Y45_04795 [Tenericutes bacterium GWC2_34_14]OHE34075.1 MAG: hypothetical protein A2012_05450 [Tenericutes bacterium GWE2_34_108]OHE35405.1 MAG: hypothetical protein A2Y46_04795 [Tenericutes bacterium GWF1_35_14]OHE38449.1 MAG: hypothetical protein A2Y44_07950 [Tenericutes bacterium GWF2_35_184]OHE42601.1 MAG: hypothetical protein A3K26_00435 [Tenericutes bacterium RIFOXYA12_FULL_35_